MLTSNSNGFQCKLYRTFCLGRKRRCGNCIGCTSPDCQQCRFCLDMPKYGGPGRKKRCCIRKECTAMVIALSACCKFTSECSVVPKYWETKKKNIFQNSLTTCLMQPTDISAILQQAVDCKFSTTGRDFWQCIYSKHRNSKGDHIHNQVKFVSVLRAYNLNTLL